MAKLTPWRNFTDSLTSRSVLTRGLLLNLYHLAGFPERKLVKEDILKIFNLQ